MKIRGPLVTLAAVAAAATGIWLVNISQQPAPPSPVAASVSAPPPPAVKPPPPTAAVAFPRQAEYVGTIPTRDGDIALTITVDGAKATAYACDSYGIEVWLRGPAANGAMTLVNTDGSSRLDGRLEGGGVVGTLRISKRQWDFTTTVVQGYDNVR